MDIITSFHNDYESVAGFERRNAVKLPETLPNADMSAISITGEVTGRPLAAMLTPQQ